MNADIYRETLFYKTMTCDINRCVSELNAATDEGDIGFWRRAYIRSFSTFIEGQLWLYKKMIKSMVLSDETRGSVNIEWVLYFTEQDWKISGNGDIELTDKKIPTKSNLKCFFRQIEKFVPGIKMHMNDSGWSDLMFYYDVRDRLTHPSDVNHVSITSDDIKKIENGRRWLVNNIKSINDGMLNILNVKMPAQQVDSAEAATND